MRGSFKRAELRRNAILCLYEDGFSRDDISAVIGVGPQTVYSALRRKGVDTGPAQEGERDEQIVAAYKAGSVLEEIGARHGITRERVRQILKKNGVTFANRGFTTREVERVERLKNRRAGLAARWQEKTRATYGCAFEQLNEINSGQPRSRTGFPAHRYLEQKRNAAARGIPWEITLPEWWAVWQESGKWAERGRGFGYCMARHGDSGAYTVDNVYITTGAKNTSDSYLVVSAEARIAKRVYAVKRDVSGFSPKQAEVLPYVQQGLNYQEIAVQLHMKPKNVWNHVNAVQRKLELQDRAHESRA